MSALPYHKRYHGDALTGFMALTLEERGAYQTLLDMMYDRGGPLIDNERLLAGYMNCSVRKWVQLRQILIQKGKITINRDGMICNNRARKEIENQSKTHRKLIEAGSKGGRTRAENDKKDNENNETGQASLKLGSSDPQANARGSRNQKPDSSDTNVSGETPAEIDPVKAMFDAGVGLLTGAGVPDKQARSLIGKWRAQVGDDEVWLAIGEAQAARISDPVPWLTKRCAAKQKLSTDPDAAYRSHALAEIRAQREWEERQKSASTTFDEQPPIASAAR